MISKQQRLESWAVRFLMQSGLPYRRASETSIAQFRRLVLEARLSESQSRQRFARRFV